MTRKLNLMMIAPDIFRMLDEKGTISSIFRPGRDLGEDLLERYHYVFPFDEEDARRDVHPRVTVHSFRKVRPYAWNAARVIRACVDLVRRERIDLVLAADPYVSGAIALAVSRLAGVPHVVEMMGEYDVIYAETGRMITPALKFRWLENAICDFVMRRTDAVVGYMECYRQFAIRHGAIPAKTYTSYGSAQEYHFEPVSSRGKPQTTWKAPGQKLVAYVGRVDKRKYADHYVGIAERLLAARPDVVCLHVGDGPDRAWVEEEAVRRGIADRFRVTGFLDNREVWKLYGEIDVFAAILAGSSLLEAGAAERPIVAYDTDWHGEFVKDGESGFLVPFRDLDGFASAVLRILDDPVLAARFGGAAREVALGRHSPQTAVATHRFLYEKLINRPDRYRDIGMLGRFS